MTQIAILQEHRELCDEIHHAVYEENRFLRQHQRAPAQAAIEGKRRLLDRLSHSLTSLRGLPASSVRDPETRLHLENTRARILQILQLDKENEQLLLRCSLAGARTSPGSVSNPSASLLQKIYARFS